MTDADRKRANVDKQLAYQDRRRLRGDIHTSVWMDQATHALWLRLHRLYGGRDAALAYAIRKLAED